MLEKNKNYQLKITDIGTDGEGIGKVDGFTLFVKDGVPEDFLEVKVIKLKKNYGYAKIVNLITPSENRVEPICNVFQRCGGCTLQHLGYKEQLKFKTKKISDNLKRIGGFSNFKLYDTIGMENPLFYRNKAQFPIGEADGKRVVGFYSQRSHNIVPVKKCFIQHPICENILEIVENFIINKNLKSYNENTHTGLLRHVLIKVGFTTNEIMVCIVINGHKLPHEKLLIEQLTQIENIKSICININTEKTNAILGKKTETIWGESFITDYIGELKFKISPLSFFQVNPVQTKILYEKVVEFANIQRDDIVIDAYCGIGTISLFLAKSAKKVFGIEVVPEAIEDAKINAEINSIKNVDFIVGKSEEIIPELFQKENIKADVIVVDPPRKGCDIKLLQTIIDMKPKKVVYVSCDSATLARDLCILCAEGTGYRLECVQGIDCFPMSTHVESVAMLVNIDI